MSFEFDYFYGAEAEQFTFFRIPKVLFKEKTFKDMSTDAKLLYGLMLDRMGLSMRNRWIDDDNRVYIIYKMEEIIEDIGCARQKVAKLLEELDKSVGLIERKRQGLGKPNIIYVKNFITANSSEYENHTSRSMNTKLQEVPKSDSNNTNINNNNYNNTDFNNTILSYPISDEELCDDGSDEPLDAIGWMRERTTYENLIKDNIDYDIMIEKFEKAWIDEIVELMVDVVCSKEPYIRINKQEYPHEVVKNRFLKIDSSHIEYIYFALRENCSNVRNIRAFLITTIYRSFETSDNWFSAKVNYDMANPKKN